MEIYRMVFSPIEVNTYILANDSGECAVIDCGCYSSREFAKFEKFLSDRHLNPVLLLNTHCHLDHIFGNRFMLDRYNLRTLSGKDDEINRLGAVDHAAIFDLEMEEPPEPAGFIEHGEQIAFGETELLALHVPGHSPGSFSFYSKKECCVFTGDALFEGSIGRTDLMGGDYDTLIRSIKSQLLVLPYDTVVYPGHGHSTTIEKEIKSNPFLS
jgi:hydroxyacylglutathione hydrolase